MRGLGERGEANPYSPSWPLAFRISKGLGAKPQRAARLHPSFFTRVPPPPQAAAPHRATFLPCLLQSNCCLFPGLQAQPLAGCEATALSPPQGAGSGRQRSCYILAEKAGDFHLAGTEPADSPLVLLTLGPMLHCRYPPRTLSSAAATPSAAGNQS